VAYQFSVSNCCQWPYHKASCCPAKVALSWLSTSF